MKTMIDAQKNAQRSINMFLLEKAGYTLNDVYKWDLKRQEEQEYMDFLVKHGKHICRFREELLAREGN